MNTICPQCFINQQKCEFVFFLAGVEVSNNEDKWIIGNYVTMLGYSRLQRLC